MEGQLASVEDLREYLGVDEGCGGVVAALRSSAVRRLNRATGIDWRARRDAWDANEALRVMVYISYYAVRDAAKDTRFLREYLTSLLCELQLAGVETDASGQEDPILGG